MMRNRLPRFVAPLAVVAFVMGACGGGTATSSPSSAPSSSTQASASAAPSSEAPSASASASATTDIQYTGPAVTITWFCCLGTGDDPKAQLPVENQVIKDFNASHPNIKLQFSHTPYNNARTALATQIASGNGPDIVGPVGIGGSEAFHGEWLDLAPLIQKYNFDMSLYPKAAIAFQNVGGQGQIGIPFDIYPSTIYYQKSLFADAGLNEPPHKYGEKYTMPDGSQVDWNYDTVRKIAMMLTVDNKGNDATMPNFDPKHIVQYGFEPQRDDLRTMGGAYFGAGQLLGSDGKTVQVPAPWAAGWKWVYDGTFKDHFIMTNAVYKAPEWNGSSGYSFDTGKVAMQENFLWNTCCIPNAGLNWDMAAIPSSDGKTTSVLNADTFRILKSTKNPDAAFVALTWLDTSEDARKLLNAYTGLPARSDWQKGYFDQLQAQKDDKGKPLYPIHVDWQVVLDSLQYADIPNFEAYMPAYNQSLDTLTKYLTRWTSTPGLNMDTEIQNLQNELQAIWNKSTK